MWEKRRKNNASGGVVVRSVLMSLAIGMIVMMVVGLLTSFLVLKGMGANVIEYGAPAGLFLGALIGGLIACARIKRMPLLWGSCVAICPMLVCCLTGVLLFKTMDLMMLLQRCGVALAGGAVAGVIWATARK